MADHRERLPGDVTSAARKLTERGWKVVLARRIELGKWVGSVLTVLLLVIGVSGTSFADLRIVSETDDERSVVLAKNGLIVSRSDPNEWFMVDCALEEVTFVHYSRYWQGPIAELGAALDREIEKILVGDDSGEGEAAEIAGFLAALLGSDTSGTKQVRVTQIGDDSVAGYKATQYRVETGDGSQWKTYELVSISQDLLRELQAEVGDCTRVMMDLTQQILAIVPLGDGPTVHSDASYRALFDQGFPVRTITKMTVFGFELETETVVVEVSHEPVPDSEFIVPSSFRRVDSLASFLGD